MSYNNLMSRCLSFCTREYMCDHHSSQVCVHSIAAYKIYIINTDEIKAITANEWNEIDPVCMTVINLKLVFKTKIQLLHKMYIVCASVCVFTSIDAHRVQRNLNSEVLSAY